MHNSFADSFLKFHAYLASILSFMYLAPGLGMLLLLTDLFMISQDFPWECTENSFSCKNIKWAESALKKKTKRKNTHTNAIKQLEFSTVPCKTVAFPLTQKFKWTGMLTEWPKQTGSYRSVPFFLARIRPSELVTGLL